MAVIQISKIQHRRGLKNNNAGIPQLSAAEIAWAIDTQELYIGNGSVADGAPYVGNTKILTEHDNILELANSYRFALNEPSVSLSVPRSLQNKLDEYVSVFDFGAVPDGSTDCTVFFENALNQLFRNADPKFKKTLFIPNGNYLFSDNLRIPSNARIRGESIEGVSLNIGDFNILLITEDGTEVAQFQDTDRPSNIEMSNLTIRHDSGQFVITGLKDSKFDSVKFLSDFELTAATFSNSELENSTASVYWENDLAGTKVDNIMFSNCKFESTKVAMRCRQEDVFETSITLDDCSFLENATSILLTGVENQKNSWTVRNSKFQEVANQALYIAHGTGTVVRDCVFIDCGNGIGNDATPSDSFIIFGQNANNIVIDCRTDRLQQYNLTALDTRAAYGEVQNANLVKFSNSVASIVYRSDTFRPLLALSALNRYHSIDYTITLNEQYNRHGTLYLTVDESQDTVAITDSYQYSSSLITDPGGAMMTNFEFGAELKTNRGDSAKETIILTYKNPIATGADGNISLFVNYGV